MSVVKQMNPFTGKPFYMISTETLAKGKLHPDNVYDTEEEAYLGQKKMAGYLLERVNSRNIRGRKPTAMGLIEDEAQKMLQECSDFGTA